MSLTAEEVIRIYGKHWGIEVFFKVCKSFLRLEKDCLSLSYDAMTAHVSIVFTRYMFLAVEQRECKDARSLGELFYLSVDELPDVCFVEAMMRSKTGQPCSCPVLYMYPFQIPAAFFKASALSVFSHGRSASVRPKWP